jgi:hypothetical protein
MDKTFMARNMEKVGPNQEQRFTSCGRNAVGGMPAGARGEGAAKVTVGRWGNGI